MKNKNGIPIEKTGQTKQLPLKRTLFFCFIDLVNCIGLYIWVAKHDCLSEEEIALCYFCYIGVKHKNQSIFFGISLQSLSKRKQRLRAKLKIPRGMSFKDVVNAI